MPVGSTEKPARNAMDSVPLQKIKEKAEAYDKTLQATDPRFQRCVKILHEDGSVMMWNHAFLMSVESEWIVCFTEHHGCHVYHETDLIGYRQYATFISGMEPL